MIRVLIADDQALVRGGVRMIVEAQPDMEVAGEAQDGREAVELARELAPDVALVDVRMPGVDGIEATRRLLAEPGTTTAVLVLTTFDQDEVVYEALRAGAGGFPAQVGPARAPRRRDPDRRRRGRAAGARDRPAGFIEEYVQPAARERRAGPAPGGADRARARGPRGSSAAAARTPTSPMRWSSARAPSRRT